MSGIRSLRAWAIRLHWIFAEQIGVDALRFGKAIRGLPAYLSNLTKFKNLYRGPLSLTPCFGDSHVNAGAEHSEYFWQDLLVAREIAGRQPVRHVDVGSRLDGFVAHVASYREIEVIDIRPISKSIPGVTFVQADVMSDLATATYSARGGYCDSASCLHALEHFGLGRYGDPINPDGPKSGLRFLANLLQPGGVLYLSVPIGPQRVEFNANWIFSPVSILDMAASHQLTVKELMILGSSGVQSIIDKESSIRIINVIEDRLGLFIFEKR